MINILSQTQKKLRADDQHFTRLSELCTNLGGSDKVKNADCSHYQYLMNRCFLHDFFHDFVIFFITWLGSEIFTCTLFISKRFHFSAYIIFDLTFGVWTAKRNRDTSAVLKWFDKRKKV